MASVVQHIVFDCVDAYTLGEFWVKVTGQPMSDDDYPGDPEASIKMPDGGARLFFVAVPEPKTVKNRVHVCLKPDGSRDKEIERLLRIGATMVDDRRNAEGHGWAVLADPDGNEFCVLGRPDPPPAEASAAGDAAGPVTPAT
jgi:predicted enzyme related to lactoylglutathione lyase